MIIKSASTFNIKSVVIALVAVHALPILFVMYTESFLNQWLPCLFVVLIPLFFLLYRPVSQPVAQNNGWAACKITGIALLSVLLLFMVGYFTTTFQPPVQIEKQAVAWVVLPGAENMAYVLRVFLQAWLFALVCVMAGRWLRETPQVSGFLSRFYAKRELVAWTLDIVVIGSTLLLLTLLIVLACQQLSYVFSRLMGMKDLFAFPQLSIFLFLFSLWMVNKATSFSKRVTDYAKKPGAHLAWVYIAFIGFTSAVWVFSQVALLGLPDNARLELAQAFNMGAASLEGFERNWPLLVMSCSFYLVAPLTVLLSRLLASGSKYVFTVALVAPIVIVAFFLSSFPSISAAFWSWMPHLHFAAVPITDELVQFRFNGFSILLLGTVLVLLSLMGRGSLFMHTMVTLTPTALGRRERRVRENIAQLFRLICFAYGIFGVLGVYGLALNVAIYLPTAITACALFIGLGLYQRFHKRLPANTCMEVK